MEETTESLRAFVENELNKENTRFSDFRNDFSNHCEDNEKKRNMMQEYADRIDFDISTFKNYCNEMRDETVINLF